jgi:hypothetical protein
MSKVNKFRAWYPDEKKMEYQDNKTPEWVGDILTNSYYIPMQWTGLKDKNGVDIYEDDLCHTNNETYAIELQEVGGAYKAVNINSDEREDDVHFLLNCNHFLEVIGHIYEEKK